MYKYTQDFFLRYVYKDEWRNIIGLVGILGKRKKIGTEDSTKQIVTVVVPMRLKRFVDGSQPTIGEF